MTHYVRCEDCARETADLTRLTQVDELSAEDLDGWGRIQPFELMAQVLHEFDEGGVVGVYHLEEDQVRLCSYDDHEHGIGLCVWSRCHRLFLLGNVCAEKYLPRSRDWLRTTRRLQSERDLLADGAPIRLLESLTELAARFERCHAGLENLKRYGRQVHDAVHHAHLRHELGVQVERHEPETETSPARTVWVTEQLHGTAIFEEKNRSLRITLGDVRSKLELATKFANEPTPDRGDREKYEEFGKTRRHLRNFEEKLRRRLNDFAVFWTQRNLALALIKTKQLREVPASLGASIEGATIVIEGPPRRVLGMEG